MAREIKNMNMAFSKKNKSDTLNEKFGVAKDDLKQEFELLDNFILENDYKEENDYNIKNETTKEIEIKINSSNIFFNKKSRYNLTLADSTINKLNMLEKVIKKNAMKQKRKELELSSVSEVEINKILEKQRTGGLRSKLIDHIVESYYEELKAEYENE